MHINVKARGPVAHGAVNAKRGDTFVVTKGEAAELEKKGLVEIMGDVVEPAASEKQAPELENKMAEDTANKSSPTKRKMG